MHSDKSAANICKLRQWHSQQPSCLAYIETSSFLASYGHERAQLEVSNTSPFEWFLYLALVLWMPVCPSDNPCHVNCCAHKQNHQLWLEQSGQFTRGLKCIHLFFQAVSTHLKPPRSPTLQQALNVHVKTAPFRKDVELLWFVQSYHERGSLHRIFIWFSIGWSGARPDQSAASICKARQWRGQQPSCFPYILLDGRSLREIMNAAFQFDLARPSGHSGGCHHIKLLQPRVNAVQQIGHSGMPE